MTFSVQVPLTERVAGATGQLLPGTAKGPLVVTEAMAAGLPPELVTWMAMATEVALSAVVGKEAGEGLNVSAPGAAPVPESDAVAAGLPLYGTERTPLLIPATVGVKVTESVQDCEAGSDAGQLLPATA